MKKILRLIGIFLIASSFSNHTQAQYCLSFDGSNDYVSVANYAGLQTASTMTVEAWINATAWKTPLYKGTVVSTGNNAGQNNGFDLRAGEGGKVAFNISIAGNWVTATTPAILQLGQWYHLAGVYTGDSVKVYVNGLLRAAVPATGAITYSTGAMYIAECPGFTGRTFNGKMDEVRFWNTARTPSEITGNICTSLTGSETGLAGYWKFDATNGTTTAINSVAGGNNGTLTNMTLATAWVSGDYTCSVNNPDVGVVDVIAPASGFNLSSTEPVSIKINNYSNQAATNFPVSYKLGNLAPVTETVSASIPAFGSYIYNFTQTVDLSAIQAYTIRSYTGMTGDADHSNDSVSKSFNNFAIGTNFAVAFTGIESITLTDTSYLNPTSALTVEAWINTSSWVGGVGSEGIISKSTSSPDQGYSITCGDNGRVKFQISDNGGWKSVESAHMLLTNRWYHVAGVFDGSSIKLYVNGDLISSTFASAISPSSVPLTIGSGFYGKLDEVRIWNIARTATEIQTNMAVALAGNETGLVGYYKLNEGLGSPLAYDGTVNSHTASLSGNFNLNTAWVSGYSLMNDDASVTGLVAPNNLTAFNGETRVKVLVKNTGLNTISNIPVAYKVGNGSWFLDTIATSLAPNQTYTHSFKNIEDFSLLTTTTLTTRVHLPGDADSRNDSAVTILTKPTVNPNTIVVFNNVQHDFASNGQVHYADAIFPEAPEKYSSVLLHVSVSCPGSGCDPWDQAGLVTLLKNGQEYELGRYITPYGIACGPWTIDVTDFKSLLTGPLTLKSYVQVWGSSGWLVTISFEFIPGASAYPFSKLTPLWNTDYQVYGDPGVSYVLPTLSIPIEAQSKHVSMRSTLTGHGQGNTNNAAEFFNVTHHVWVNGTNQFAHHIWKADCGSNSCSNQGGTWTLSRAGWCPGQGVNSIINDLTPLVTTGQNVSLNYVLQSYTNLLNTGYNGNGHTEPFYRIHTYLVETSDSAQNFADFKDGEATRITSPIPAQSLSANEIVTAVMSNKGSLPVVNPVLSYFLNGVMMQTDTILQTLNPGDSLTHIFCR
ncbi:MAG: peptide-N-glycosidase F-related protein [Bacteroidetes bacterium]|nr:peptide-N-glycosidase F-related protein [Bacteroidota bacterium]